MKRLLVVPFGERQTYKVRITVGEGGVADPIFKIFLRNSVKEPEELVNRQFVYRFRLSLCLESIRTRPLQELLQRRHIHPSKLMPTIASVVYMENHPITWFYHHYWHHRLLSVRKVRRNMRSVLLDFREHYYGQWQLDPTFQGRRAICHLILGLKRLGPGSCQSTCPIAQLPPELLRNLHAFL